MSEQNQSNKFTKDRHRQKIWEYMMDNDLINFPFMIYYRIPNFKGADLAAERLAKLDEFKNAQVIKINPDKPQEPLRLMALKAGKEILVPSSKLKSGLFFHVKPPSAKSKKEVQDMATFQGICTNGKPVDVDFNIKVDLVVLGAVCVSRQGYRIGRGEGFSDLEFAMMKTAGAICDKTVVMTTIHDCQLVDNLDDKLFGEHDVPVDIIVTPTQTIFINERLKKPSDINWHKLTPRIVSTRMLEQLNKIKQRTDDNVTGETPKIIPEPESQQKNLTRYKKQKKKVKPYRKSSIEPNTNSQNGNQITRKNKLKKTPQENTVKPNVDNQKENEVQKSIRVRKLPPKSNIEPKIEGHNDNKVVKKNRMKTLQKVINPRPKTDNQNDSKVVSQNKIKKPLQESNTEPKIDNHNKNNEQQKNKMKKYSSRRRQIPKKSQKVENVNSDSTVTEKNDQATKESSKKKNGRHKSMRFKSQSRIDFSLKLSNVGSNVRIRDLKNELLQRGVKPSYITWFGKGGFCYLHFSKLKNKNTQANEAIQVDSIVGNLQQLYIGEPKNMRNDNLIIVQPACPITRIEITDVTSV